MTSLIADELRKDAETDEDMDGASKRSAVERALELQSMSEFIETWRVQN